MAESNALLVTGASGYVERRTIEGTTQVGEGALDCDHTDAGKLADLAERGVDVRRADFSNPSGLQEAFSGASRMLLVSTDAMPRAALGSVTTKLPTLPPRPRGWNT